MALNSKTTLKIIDLIGEGPIKGIQGREGVYLNETSSVDKSVQRSDFEQRKGALKQVRLSDSKTTSALQNVGEDVGKSYEETTNAKGEVDTEDYGAGQVIQTVTDLEADLSPSTESSFILNGKDFSMSSFLIFALPFTTLAPSMMSLTFVFID